MIIERKINLELQASIGNLCFVSRVKSSAWDMQCSNPSVMAWSDIVTCVDTRQTPNPTQIGGLMGRVTFVWSKTVANPQASEFRAYETEEDPEDDHF